VTSSANETYSKLQYKFLLRTLLIIDEEIVERSEAKPDTERHASNNVKDAMRVESVQQILQMITNVL